jgi:murein DD-endopeptidase MepM/ murein hydrolase activator NlpD
MIAALLMVVVLAAPSCWRPPVDVPVAVAFRAPACTWCPGHRGVEFRPPVGTPVRAITGGVVTFVGTVAGTKYLVTEIAGGRKVTYGMLAAFSAGVGDRVDAGQIVGHSSARLYLGLRQGNRAVDPMPLLARRVGPLRLVPLDRRDARPAGQPRWTCATGPPRR